MKKRYLTKTILDDLVEKMVFIGGARQVGKTSLALNIAENNFPMHDYLNWDYHDDRKNILQSRFRGDAKIVLFDEIHKYKDWKNYLKGQFDKHRNNFKILVTGSARLDIYRKGGDSLREDLPVSHKTVAKWIDILEKFYYHFRIYPFLSKRIRSLKKEPKLYLYNWSEIADEEGKTLENMIASHLLKLCHYLNDVDGYKTELYFLRDLDGREVDFLVTENCKPWFAVEVKSSFRDISKNLIYFGEKINIPFLYQITSDKNIDIRKDKIRIISADRFLASLI